MPVQCDYHMHTPLCQHAAGPMEAYIERGIELGLREIGFADHNPLPRGMGANVRMREDELEYYVNRVLDLQFQYHGKIDVLLGLEMDYVEGLESYCEKQVASHPWDYIIGSVHYLDRECRVGSWPRDFLGTAAELEARYFELVRKLARSGLCDIIGHLDVPKRAGYCVDPASEEVARALREIADAGLCIEVNTSGYRHPELRQPEPYPTLAIIEKALALGIPLAVNSDAHAPEQVGTKFQEMESFLLRKGCKQLARFERRERQMYAL